jgi:hypothetical protein
MSFDFPNNPTDGDVYAPPGGPVWHYGEGAWRQTQPLGSNTIKIVDGVDAPAAVAGYVFLFVDSADGDLKVRFGDGTIKTISVDT